MRNSALRERRFTLAKGRFTAAEPGRRLSFAGSARLRSAKALSPDRRSPMTAFPYLSHAGFLGAAPASPDHPFAVAGVCWDGSVTNRPGARFGPRAIRTASHMLCDATHPHFDVSPTPFVGDAGTARRASTSATRAG
jgi:hypothetical protein